MSDVDVSRRRFLRLGGLLERRAVAAEPPASSGTPFDGPPPPAPWERRPPAERRKTRFAQIRRPSCIAHAGSTCSVCVERCPVPNAIQIRAGKPVIDADACDGCGACADACPAPGGAIHFIPYFDGGRA